MGVIVGIIRVCMPEVVGGGGYDKIDRIVG